MTKKISISCVIPTYNGLTLLQKHIPSILEALVDGDQLIIADDASTDDSVSWLTNNFNLKTIEEEQVRPDVKLFRGLYKKNTTTIEVVVMVNLTNQRFAQTVNRAVVFCKHRYFFLVNNDVSVEKNTFSVLKEEVVHDPTIFAIGCLEYEQSDHGEKSGKNKLWFEKGLFKHSKADNFESGPTAWASGGSALFSTDKWRQLGGFDSAFYPAYWEDIDVSFRARKEGWKIVFNKHAVVYHKHESTNSQVFGNRHVEKISWKNSLVFAWKHGTFLQKIEFLFWYPYWYIQRLRTR